MTTSAQLLVVCTGNICRSPYIERLLQQALDACSHGVLVRSAGTSALAGRPMDPRAAHQLMLQGGDPAGFVARDLTAQMAAAADLVLTATRKHRGLVAAMHPRALHYCFTLRDFADLAGGLSAVPVDPAATGQDPGARVRAVTAAVAARRGLTPPLSPAEADIVDPFRREDAVFALMAAQINAALPAVTRALEA